MIRYPQTKRVFDAIFACALLVLLSPIFLVVAIMILFDDGKPIFFAQKRVGRGNSLFKIHKFRSMPTGVPTVASAHAEELPITRVGSFIRRTSIDEIPQLLNVIRGEMSFVGPRPALPTQTELLEVRQKNGAQRLRPGITGLAQVNGFDGMSEIQKGGLDGKYAASESFRVDFAIIGKTLVFLVRKPPRV